MIEFTGQLSGPALKRFLRRANDHAQAFLLTGELFILPAIVILAFTLQYLTIIGAYLAFSILILLMVRMPKSKKEVAAIAPRRIYTDEEEIVCEAEKYTERRYIEDVKCVRDFGEFYELVFPFGKVSEKFICQKELLTRGTLEEFESLFGDKLIRS